MRTKFISIFSSFDRDIICSELSSSSIGKNEPMMKGKFQPTWSSLENYQVPEWFRNAKFGIWAHWGPQCVEGSGDWMARSMYLEGSAEYKHHVEHYGHPSEVGFKDIIPLFKAENGTRINWLNSIKDRCTIFLRFRQPSR